MQSKDSFNQSRATRGLIWRPFHIVSLLTVLSTRGWKFTHLSRRGVNVRPRYLVGKHEIFVGEPARISLRFNPSHRIGIIVDFWKLVFNPKALPNNVRSSAKAKMPFLVGFTKMAVSSAYIEALS